MGYKNTGFLQNLKLIHPGRYGEIGRDVSQGGDIRTASHRHNHIDVFPLQGLHAITVEAVFFIQHGSQRNVNQGTSSFGGCRDRNRKGRPGKAVTGRKGIRHGLEFRGGIYDGIRIIVILQQFIKFIRLIAMLPQFLHPRIDFGHPRHHAEDFSGLLLHQLCGVPVERKGGCRTHIRDSQPFGIELSPDADGIGHDAVGLPFSEFFQYSLFHGQGHMDGHGNQRRQIPAHFLINIRRGGRHVFITADAGCTSVLYPIPEFPEGIIMNFMPPFH